MVLTKKFELGGSIFTSLIITQGFDRLSELCFDSSQKLLKQQKNIIFRFHKNYPLEPTMVNSEGEDVLNS
jgi:hypothetical protein